VLSSLSAVIAGLMSVAQNKDADPLPGFGLELIAISSVIVGGAAIFGGRGRILGSCLGAILIGLIDKVLREGIPTTRTIDLADGETKQVAAMTQLPPGAVPVTLIRSLLSLQIILKDGSSFVLPQQWQNVFIGLILIVAVVGDIWLRQHNILGQWFGRRRIVEEPARVEPVKEAKA
jgi:ribose/xylose/arabinose/galactoside ABC-type transport system permease subunit